MEILWFNLKCKFNNIVTFILLNISVYKLYINKIFIFIIFIYSFNEIIIIILLLLSSFKTLLRFLNIIDVLIYYNYI